MENGAGASEKPPPDEDSKELCTPPPVDPGECGAGDTPIAGDGVKGESSPAMVAVAPPFADGNFFFSFSTVVNNHVFVWL